MLANAFFVYTTFQTVDSGGRFLDATLKTGKTTTLDASIESQFVKLHFQMGFRVQPSQIHMTSGHVKKFCSPSSELKLFSKSQNSRASSASESAVGAVNERIVPTVKPNSTLSRATGTADESQNASRPDHGNVVHQRVGQSPNGRGYSRTVGVNKKSPKRRMTDKYCLAFGR
ncbi:unnamed protein product [Protopolystoma xenopodis]|uniref:Uncharacterized protein n=1 Tax=Protopolystoma xenopodis TaxID=117903 RepID=A0A3S5CIA9_9PLAT|nr:unnamed protein product [Protopolystoma xenopodis]